MCSGYYRYDRGYRPTFPGEECFGGQFIHPQFWHDDIDVTDKKVVVIGMWGYGCNTGTQSSSKSRARNDVATFADLHDFPPG